MATDWSQFAPVEDTPAHQVDWSQFAPVAAAPLTLHVKPLAPGADRGNLLPEQTVTAGQMPDKLTMNLGTPQETGRALGEQFVGGGGTLLNKVQQFLNSDAGQGTGPLGQIVAKAIGERGNEAEQFAGSPEQYKGVVPQVAGVLARGAPTLAATLAVPEAEAPGIAAEAAPTLSKIPGLIKLARTVAEQSPRAAALTALTENPQATPAETARDLAINTAAFGVPASVGGPIENRVLAGGGIGALINEIASRLQGQTPTPQSDLAMAFQSAVGAAAHAPETSHAVEKPEVQPSAPSAKPAPNKVADLEDALRRAGLDIPEPTPEATPPPQPEPSTAPATETAATPIPPHAGTASPERPIAQQWDAMKPEERAVIAQQIGLAGRRAVEVAGQSWADLNPGWQALFEKRGLEPEPELAPAKVERTPEPAPQASAEVPFMITARMRADLAARGYDPAQVSKMTPAQAHEILKAAPEPVENADERGTAAVGPVRGMGEAAPVGDHAQGAVEPAEPVVAESDDTPEPPIDIRYGKRRIPVALSLRTGGAPEDVVSRMGARASTAAGAARVKDAQKLLRETINNSDMTPKQRAEAIRDRRSLVQYMETHAGKHELEMVWVAGDRAVVTGPPKNGMQPIMWTEGHRAGREGVRPAPDESSIRAAEHVDTGLEVTEHTPENAPPEARELVARTRQQRETAQGDAAMREHLREASTARGEAEANRDGLRPAVEDVLGTGHDVEFVRDVDGLPDDVRSRLPASEGRRGKRAGLHDPETGRTFIFTDAVHTPEDAAWTAAHEVAGHKGLRALINDRAGVRIGDRTPTEALDKALDMARQNPTVAKLADVIREQRKATKNGETVYLHPRTAAEEALAEVAAATKTGNWQKIADRYGVDVPKAVREGVKGAVAKFVERLRRILHAVMGKTRFTDDQVHQLVADAGRYARADAGEIGGEGLESVAHDQTDTPEFRRWFGDSKVVDAQGKPLVVYHGSKRPDRINSRFRKTRATSGPMAFFTESQEVSSGYAAAKRDTSLEPPEDYAGWFKYKPRGSAHEVDIDRAWYSLTPEQRATIADKLPRVSNTTPEGNESDTPRLGSPGEFGLTSGDHWRYEIQQAHGNVLKAAKELWLAGGTLFGREHEFMDVLRLGGMDMDRTRFDDPWAEYPAVFPVYLKIEHPLDTANISPSVVDAVAARARRQRAPDEYGADIWAKNTRDPRDWADALREDVESAGAGHVWTSIPDFVTRTLKSLGYDGIKDTGGKNGGMGHTVWVPFDDKQVKSATGNRGTFDPNSPNILESVTPDEHAQPPKAEDVLPRSFVSKTLSRLIPGGDDVASAVRMAVAPMAEGSVEARATAKDFANTMREARYQGIFADKQLTKHFDRQQLEKMWNAADEQSVLEQKGEDTAGKGLATLTPEERRGVEILQANARKVFEQARALGMVEGEGLPSYTPRMVVRMGDTGPRPFPNKDNPVSGNVGRNVRTTSANLRQRLHLTAAETEAAAKAKLGEDAELVRNIRTLPLATSKLSEAVAGRSLINRIKEIGKQTGQDTVREGAAPDDGYKWFTIQHPAFTTWRPRFETDPETGKVTAVKDENGNTVFDRVPIYVRGDFAGPLKAVLSEKSGPIYNGLMALKGKTMSVIMYSPLIHNAVEWGRALPAMPGKVLTLRVYFEGNRAKNDPETMREAIKAGLVPIGQHYGFQDISSIQEGPNIIPGRSWTAKLLAAVPNLFDKRAGGAVRRAIDKAGDIYHNKLLWDRVGDLQMGLYTNFRDHLAHKGFAPASAQKMAAHFANRYAGALPMESMSNAARKIANLLLFSRSFTLGNLGAMKDMVAGLPRDVQSQILRDGGMEELKRANAYSKRKAIAIIAADMALMYLGNSLLQSGIAVARGQNTLSDEEKGYMERLAKAFDHVKENPLALLHPFDLTESLTPMSRNEPGKQDRVLVGHAPDGTAIYMRNPTGKIGEEFKGWLTSPLDMLKRKMGTFARPLYELVTNDKGFGRKVYDPYDDSTAGMIKNAGRIAGLFVQDQVPMQSIKAVKNAIQGKGDTTTNILQAAGPLAGVTFSKGAPGGPAVGIAYQAKDEHEFAVSEAIPGIRDMIRGGDTAGAVEKMRGLGMPPSYIRWVIRTTHNPSLRLSPKGLRDFQQYASPEARQQMREALDSDGQ